MTCNSLYCKEIKDASWIHILLLTHFVHLHVEKQVFLAESIFLGHATFVLDLMIHQKIVYDANPFHQDLIKHWLIVYIITLVELFFKYLSLKPSYASCTSSSPSLFAQLLK